MTNETVKTASGKEYKITRTTNSVNGNPRYIVSWLSLGLDHYGHTEATKRAGLSLYRGKSYGGGFVFQSYSVQQDAELWEQLGLFPKA